MLRLLVLGLGLCAGALDAAQFVVPAGNAGALSGAGRELSFDLSAVSGGIAAARLEIDISYSRARELRIALVDPSEVVELPIAEFAGVNPAVGLAGRYRIDDRATHPWLSAAAIPNIANAAAVQAFRLGHPTPCVNLIGPYLEYDIDRAQPLRLRVARAAGASGSGQITAARLIIDTEAAEVLRETGFEELDGRPEPCQRPSFDVLPNGAQASVYRSPLTLLDYATGAPDWRIRQFEPPQDFGPFAFGAGATTQPYPGRFGGRSRMNLGFWDAASGSLNFSTGTGARSLSLPGNWTATPHVPIPGDYDGDGITDLAIAFLGEIAGQPRWIGRFRFSADGRQGDLGIDPRVLFPAVYNSSQIGWGAGQDADGDGRDEITVYALAVSNEMRLMQIQFERNGSVNVFSGPSWGVLGDRMVLGNWIAAASGNRYGVMVVRANAGVWEWYLHPNPTPTLWGFSTDLPLSIDIDDDERNDIAVWRPSDQKLYAIRSSDNAQVSFAPFGNPAHLPLAWLLGLTAPQLR